MSSGKPFFPEVEVSRTDLLDKSDHIIMSVVTKAMWDRGVGEEDMMRYCEKVKDKESYSALSVTEKWVSVV